jgi:putative ABC transport system ATP-binding protein
VIKIDQLTKTYRTNTVQTTALKDIDLIVDDGDFIAVMGPSGCGKSSLLNVIGLLDRGDVGSYWLDEIETSQLKESRLAEIRKVKIGFIFQSFNLIEELTVEQNIELALLYHPISASERHERVQEAMDKVGIGHRAQHFPSQLSGGQQQRVAVGRAVVARPKLILADEPTGNLDSTHGGEVMQMLRQLNETGTTVVMVTHTARHADYASRIVQMIDGQISGSVQRQASLV